MDQGYIKPIFGRYRLPSLYRQFCGYYFLISDLKALKVFTSFNSVGTISQILGPKNDRLSYSLYTLDGTRWNRKLRCVAYLAAWISFIKNLSKYRWNYIAIDFEHLSRKYLKI